MWTQVEPLADTSEQRAYWEPWVPKLRDRVRVRLSGECQYARDMGHRLGVGGLEGTVAGVWREDRVPMCMHDIPAQLDRLKGKHLCDPTYEASPHRFSVMFDEAKDWADIGVVYRAAFMFAAAELDPVDPER